MKTPWNQMLSMIGMQGSPTRFSGISNPQNPHHVAFLRSLKANKNLEQPLTTRLEQLKVVVFDLETTGFTVEQGDEIISIGAVKFNGLEIENEEHFYTLVNPEREIPQSIIELTGIDRNAVVDAPPLTEAIGRFMAFVENRILIAHFSRHDKKFLESALWSTSRTKLYHRMMDTVMLFRYLYPDWKDYSLETIIGQLNIDIKKRHHALNDARMAADLWRIGLNKLMEQGVVTLEDLYHSLSQT